VDKKTKLINIRIAPEEYAQIKSLADEREMTVSQYVRYMATIFLMKDINPEIERKGFSATQFENDLKRMAKTLDQQKRYIELMQHSLNSISWRLESQFRKLRVETEQELKQDVNRIKILMEEDSEPQSEAKA
jgi:Mobilization protein NikA